MPLRQKLEQLDIVGVIISLGFLVAITLPLQDGGVKYPWTDGRILGPLIASVFILGLLLLWCRYRGREHALIPLELLRDRNLVGCAAVSCLCYLLVLVDIYYIPRLYQAVRGSSPTKSGIDILPSVIGMSLLSFGGGVFAGITGHYWTLMAVSPIFGIIGSAMLYSINFDTPNSYLIGAQILAGVSMGACIQAPVLATQANVKRQLDTSRSVGIVTFVQRVGGTIGSGMASGIFFSLLPQELQKNNVPAEWAERAISAPESLGTFPAGPIQDGAKQAFTRAIADVLVIGIPACALNLFIIILLIKCTNLRTKKVTPLSAMPSAIRAKLTGRKAASEEQQQDADVEKAAGEPVPQREVEEEIVAAALAVPEVSKDGEAVLAEAEKEHSKK